MMVNGPDGTPHNFPDDATNDEILQFFGQGTGGPPTSGSAGGGSSVSAQTNQPSFTQRMLSGWAQQPRILGNALTGGGYDILAGLARSALPGGGTIGQNIQRQQQMTDAGKSQIGTIPTLALEGTGAILGPGKLSQTENMARMAAPGIQRFATRVAGGALEGETYAGEQAATRGQPVVPAMVKGGLTGAPFAAAVPIFPALVNKIADPRLPVPKSADYIPGPGNWSFRSAQDQATADKLATLENMQYNASLPSSRSLPTQVSGMLAKDVETGESQADQLGFGTTAGSTTAVPGAKPFFPQQSEQDALSQVGKTTPVSSFMVQHPRVTQGTISAVGEVPAMMLGLHGNPMEAIGAEALSVGGHIGAATIPNKFANQGAQAALDNAKRVIAGTATQADRSNLVNDPRFGQAMQALLFQNTLGQQDY